MPRDLHATIDAVWRIEAGKIIGAVARLVRDVGLAEELAQDALVAALEHWPCEGMPDNPAAWLMTTAKHRALDRLRQETLHLRKQQELGADADARGDHVVPDFSDALDERDRIGDDLLRLIFTACHPLLPKEAQVALTLRLLGGLSTQEIARAFLQPEPTVAQRIVRAKRALTAARVPFEVPQGQTLRERLDAVLSVIYLIFNEGYAATSGGDWMRPALCEEALRLCRVLAQLMTEEAEVHGLMALMEIQASRLHTRTDAGGRPVLLLDQDRGRWDRLLIGRGLAALERARALGGEQGPYTLQASIAACHARARTAGETDWHAIVGRYDALARRLPSPVVELNRAVAVGMATGPEAALPLVHALTAEPVMARYHLTHAVRADLLTKLGRTAEARAAIKLAMGLTANEQERQLLGDRLRALGP
jgi:RNA polymerase sigma factor (sigma-70 family)